MKYFNLITNILLLILIIISLVFGIRAYNAQLDNYCYSAEDICVIDDLFYTKEGYCEHIEKCPLIKNLRQTMKITN